MTKAFVFLPIFLISPKANCYLPVVLQWFIHLRSYSTKKNPKFQLV